MKTLKKLLPISTLICTGVVVAPTITSCSKGISDLDYIPTVGQHAPVEFTSTDIADAEYFSQAQQNTEIIIQDYCWTTAQAWTSWLNNIEKGYTNKSISFSVSMTDVRIEKRNLDMKDYYLISCNIHDEYTRRYTHTYNDSTTGNEVVEKVNEHVSTSYQINNICLDLSYSSSSKLWSIYFDRNNKFDWSAHEDYSSQSTREITENGTTKFVNNSRSTSLDYNKYTETLYINGFNSYYLKNTTLK